MIRSAAILLLALLPAFAGEPVPARAHFRIPVRVESSKPLGTTDFTATIGGQETGVLGVRGPEHDLLLIVVLDLAGDLAEVVQAKQSLIASVGQLPERTYVGVMRAQDGLSVLLDPTSDHAAIAKAVEEMPVSGKAALLDTVEQAAKLADAVLTKSAVRVAVLYITDSDVRNYREDFTNPVINSSDSRDLSRRFPEGLIREKILKVENNLAAREAPIFIVHLSYRTDRLNEAYQRGLMQIAESTGGASAFCRSEAEIPAAITRTIEAAQSVYIVDVKAPQRLPRSAPVTIESGSGTVQHPPRIVLEK